MKVTLVKRSKAKGASKSPKTAGPIVAYQIFDDENGSFTVSGSNAAGDTIDISSLATMTVVSDAPAVVTVSPPVGVTDAFQALSPGTANLTIVVTFTSGTPAPLTVTQPITVTADPNVTGLSISFGTPTAR